MQKCNKNQWISQNSLDVSFTAVHLWSLKETVGLSELPPLSARLQIFVLLSIGLGSLLSHPSAFPSLTLLSYSLSCLCLFHLLSDILHAFFCLALKKKTFPSFPQPPYLFLRFTLFNQSVAETVDILLCYRTLGPPALGHFGVFCARVWSQELIIQPQGEDLATNTHTHRSNADRWNWKERKEGGRQVEKWNSLPCQLLSFEISPCIFVLRSCLCPQPAA